MAEPGTASAWKQTACILCSINCGIEVQLAGRRLARIRGDRAHPTSQGYTCEKPARLDHYQNGRHRLTSPLRRRADGSFEAVDWDTAVRGVAGALAAVRDRFGGESILYYGGGGQGNHLPGAYARATRAALGSVYASNALAQEKTGEFWVDGRLFGRPNCHTAPDFEHAEVAVFVGKNPWQSHGFPRARAVLREIAKDSARTLVVIDPRRTETAELADFHLAVRPGTDAFCLAALLAVLVEEDLLDRAFLAERTTGADEVLDALGEVPIAEYCARAGVPEAALREVARRIGRAGSVSILEDLGIQQAPHSTLSSYLEKLAVLLTGNFGKPGGMNLHTAFGALIGRGAERRSPVGGHRVIAGMLPCNAIPEEVLTDHPKRFRAMLVESANPAHSLADSQRMRQALEALECLVVIDVALTETARLADWVLPAASQFEKWESTFFTLEFPRNAYQLRAPLLEPLPGTLPEPEIHARLVRALGALSEEDLAPLREAARAGRAAYGAAFLRALAERPKLGPLAPVVLYETLGPMLPGGARAAAVVWALAQQAAQAYPDSLRRAGFDGATPLEQGEKLFDAILASRSGVVFSDDPPEATWERVVTDDGRVHTAVPELLGELRALRGEDPAARDPAFPFVLAAGERRTSTANTIYRDPTWRRKDAHGALRMNPADAGRLGIRDGGRARVTTKRGSVEAQVELTDTLQPGHVTLPNGLGLAYPGADGREIVTGVPPNELTASEDRDWIAGTPWHKHVRARVEALPAAESGA
jgi:anaerobic selenocysteine-containing dehydrogenase